MTQTVDVFQRTREFAEQVLGMKAPLQPTRLSSERKEWTGRALQEELDEFLEAETLADEIDALQDLIYFAAGRMYEMGVNGGMHFDEVHGKNVLKKRGRLEKRSHGLSDEGGIDATKPEGWTPPDHDELIAFQRRDRGLVTKTAAGTFFDVHDIVNPKPKVLVLGYGRHGKDTAAEMLAESFDLRHTSSSMFLAEHVLMPYFNSLMGHPGYATVEDCYNDRHTGDNRAIWYQQISEYNTPDSTRTCREMLKEFDIYVGMRADHEFEASHDLFDFVMWVERPGIEPEADSSMTVTVEQAQRLAGDRFCMVMNDGSLDDLHTAVEFAYINRFTQGDSK